MPSLLSFNGNLLFSDTGLMIHTQKDRAREENFFGEICDRCFSAGLCLLIIAIDRHRERFLTSPLLMTISRQQQQATTLHSPFHSSEIQSNQIIATITTMMMKILVEHSLEQDSNYIRSSDSKLFPPEIHFTVSSLPFIRIKHPLCFNN
jgi:hypothetical protein